MVGKSGQKIWTVANLRMHLTLLKSEHLIKPFDRECSNVQNKSQTESEERVEAEKSKKAHKRTTQESSRRSSDGVDYLGHSSKKIAQQLENFGSIDIKTKSGDHKLVAVFT